MRHGDLSGIINASKYKWGLFLCRFGTRGFDSVWESNRGTPGCDRKSVLSCLCPGCMGGLGASNTFRESRTPSDAPQRHFQVCLEVLLNPTRWFHYPWILENSKKDNSKKHGVSGNGSPMNIKVQLYNLCERNMLSLAVAGHGDLCHMGTHFACGIAKHFAISDNSERPWLESLNSLPQWDRSEVQGLKVRFPIRQLHVFKTAPVICWEDSAIFCLRPPHSLCL